MVKGSCHCGAVRFVYPERPEWLTDCNCSICRRLKPLWAYARASEVELQMTAGATIAYVQGDRTLAVHSCRTCGCTTHWSGLAANKASRMAVNFRMCDPGDIATIRVRRLDGADTWEFLD